MNVQAEEALARLREETGYGQDDSGLDSLLAYKDGLEELLVDAVPKAAAWDRMSRMLDRNAGGGSHASAGDVCATGFALQKDVQDGGAIGRTWA